MKPDEFKKLINEIGSLIDKRAETTEEFLAGKITESEERTNKRIDDLQDHLHDDIRASEEHTNTALIAPAAGQKEIRDAMATKADVLDVGVKVDRLKKRIEGIEDDLELPHRDKN